MAYDSAITVFSPDGYLLQVEYATEAANKGAIAMAVLGKDCVVIIVERCAVTKLKDPSTSQKVFMLDEGLVMAFAGLQADARVLVDRARTKCQNYRLNMDDCPSVHYIASFVSSLQQQFTIKGGMRPFGVSSIMVGFSDSGMPELYQTEPHGILRAWKGYACGRNSNTVREYLEKHYQDEMSTEDTLDFAVKSMLEAVENASYAMEAVIVKRKDNYVNLDASCAQVEKVPQEELERICVKYSQED